MELKEFIQQSLVDIMEGIYAAQQGVSGKGMKGVQIHPTNLADLSKGREVKFDIAVAASDKTGAKAGAGIQVLKAGIDTKHEQATSSRIQFNVPIVYPFQEHKKD